MEKKMFLALSDNVELSNLFLGDMNAVKEYIESDANERTGDELECHEWTIRPVFMTQHEFDNLPEYQF